MKSRATLSLILCAAVVAPLSAEPYGFGPPSGPGYSGPMGAPWGAERMPPGMPSWGPSSGPAPSAESAAPVSPAAESGAAGLSAQAMNPALQASTQLKAGMDKLLGFLGQDERPNNLQVAAFLDREIAPYFDFDYMAQWVAGPAYAGMRPEEKKALAGQLEVNFLETLARNLAGYDGQQIKMLPPRRGARGAVNINVVVMQAGTYPTRLEFRMSDSGSGWKVYDVAANGQSAASYYRQEFQRTARQQLGYVPR
ncbi:MlaC/ttg2D family ABC transporter substrate-binding protein [Thiocystis violacea]|uniref:MlaC/ttg2D family ABC transporter substrate-binding protein n=1 Tax=Thiocystis violacea TaxID=13725 RepID=UPI001903F66F|nr:ABC transporter substrate-binding protein [Thiocystis violacea]MBK1721456.1 hypothetical protein [Thiocystis violacea]